MVVDITIIITIPDPSTFYTQLDKNNKIVKLRFNLITKDDFIIGEDLLLTLHYNDSLFDKIDQDKSLDKTTHLFLTNINTV
mmetsp:Transcript_11058/g.9794  ORF Transcript_11058/g.9794 Transcript_11058/m.9794 type:complete len:81 (+) Transcript_11058:571-813(+)